MIDPGEGKTHAAAWQAGEGDLELERLAHQSGGAAGRRRSSRPEQKIGVGGIGCRSAGDDNRRADDCAEFRLDLNAMARPINEQRRH